MFIDDLSFDGLEPGVSGDPGAEAAERAFRFWNEMQRRREAEMTIDIRTQRLAVLLDIANSFTNINGKLNYLIRTAENDEGVLRQLQNQVAHAEQRADFIRGILEASNG